MTVKELFAKAGATLPDGYHFCLCVHEEPAAACEHNCYTSSSLIGIVTEVQGRAMHPMSFVEPFLDFSPWQMERNYFVIPGDIGEVDGSVFKDSLPYAVQDVMVTPCTPCTQCTTCTHCGEPLPEPSFEPGLCVECKAVFDLRREDYP